MQFISHEKLKDRLAPILDLIHRQELVEQLVERQQGEPGTLASELVHRRHRETLAGRDEPAPSWTTALRPFSLAMSSPRSARRSIVSAVSPGWTSVTPKLAVMLRPFKAG